jgi:vacuolar iron transporter family protein
MARRIHKERHVIERIGWLRAAILGANDGVISTGSLMMGVAAAAHSSREVLVSGLAGLFAGGLSMAVGEYVSVSSQADTERAALGQERAELQADPDGEVRELAQIYVDRGLDPKLAREVAEQFMRRDALEAHARDELGITDIVVARPVQAALASASSFSVGAAIPIVGALLAPSGAAPFAISGVSLAGLAVLGALGAEAGGAKRLRATVRILIGGAVAMAVTSGVGALISRAVG